MYIPGISRVQGEDSTLDAEAALLRSKGHEVEIQLFDNADTVKGFAGKLRAGISAIYNRQSARILSSTIKRFNPDIIHVHNFFFAGSPSIFFAAKRHKVPVVTTIHNYRLICANCLLLRDNKVCELCVTHSFPWYGVKYKCYHGSAIQSAVVGSTAAIHKWIGTWKNKVNMFIAPANFIRSKLIASSFNVPQERITVKHNFIPDPGFSDGASRQSFYLFVGRLSEEKGVETLLKAWAHMPDKQLVIVGDGPERDRLTSTYGHLPQIDFAGKKSHPEVLELMKQCKALLFPSIWYEGLPLTIIEALATGTPVIASRLGAMEEMIRDRHNGLLFHPRDPEQLSAAVRYIDGLVDDRQFSLYDGARVTYLERYHPEQCYQTVMHIYNNILSIGKRE